MIRKHNPQPARQLHSNAGSEPGFAALARSTPRLIAAALALATTAAVAAPYEISADGLEVADTQNGLTWRRCAEGLQWDGAACSGQPQLFTFDQARAHAQAQAGAAGKPWRVPTMKEMLQLAAGRNGPPSIDARTFPGTPPKPFWSSTPYTSDGQRGSYVHFANGSEYNDYRSSRLHLRLVRNGN
jgi:hypothetical protein